MKLLRFFLPRIEYILFAAIFWGIVANGPRLLNFDGDLPRHILTGNLILQTQRVATTDIFSFRTTGYPSFPHEWLAQVIFATLYNWLGLDGIILLTATIIVLTWGIVYRQAMQKSKSFFSALIFIVLGLAASQIHVLPRPHIFTYLLTAIWITLLESLDEQNTRSWWFLPVVMVLWVNLHGMFVLGMIILGIYLVGDFWRIHPCHGFEPGKPDHFYWAAALPCSPHFYRRPVQKSGRRLHRLEVMPTSPPKFPSINRPTFINRRPGRLLFCYSLQFLGWRVELKNYPGYSPF